MKTRYLILLLILLSLFTGCSKPKPIEGQVVYLKRVLFPVYETGDVVELNKKMKDMTEKIHFARYSTDFGPGDLYFAESKNLPPCFASIKKCIGFSEKV